MGVIIKINANKYIILAILIITIVINIGRMNKMIKKLITGTFTVACLIGDIVLILLAVYGGYMLYVRWF